MSTMYEEFVKRDELVYAEKCCFMEALFILRYVYMHSHIALDHMHIIYHNTIRI